MLSLLLQHFLRKYVGTGKVILVDSTEGSSIGRLFNDKSTTSRIVILAVIQLSHKNGRT